MVRVPLILVSLIAIALLMATANAKPPPTPARDAARLTKLGIGLQKNGRHLEAIRIFDDALSKMAHVKIRYYKMKSYQALGRFEEVSKILESIIEDPQLQDRRAELDELQATMKQALRAYPVRIVTPGIEAADVYIDGKLRGKTPLVVELVARGYLLKIEAKGYLPISRSIQAVPSNDTKTVSVSLEKAPEVVPDPVMDPGPPEPVAPNTWLPWTLIGAGGAAVLGSAGFWGKHVSDSAKLDDLPPGYSQSSINLILGGVLTGLGAGLIVTGVLLMPDDEPSEGDGEVTVPSVGWAPLEGGGAVFVGGRF